MSTLRELEILVHCHVSDVPLTYLEAPDIQETISRFLNEGIIELEKMIGGFHTYRTTEKGRAWLFSMLAVPYPRAQKIWVDKDGNAIDGL